MVRPQVPTIATSCKSSKNTLLAKIVKLGKAKLLRTVFINSQFNYASVISMFRRKTDNLNMRKKIQQITLKIVFNNNEFFEDFLLHNVESAYLSKTFTAMDCQNI